MTLLGEFINFRERTKSMVFSAIYGTSFLKVTKRRKYNPMYWMLGEEKVKCLHPSDILIEKNKNYDPDERFSGLKK